jgi:hypothetical protein
MYVIHRFVYIYESKFNHQIIVVLIDLRDSTWRFKSSFALLVTPLQLLQVNKYHYQPLFFVTCETIHNMFLMTRDIRHYHLEI